MSNCFDKQRIEPPTELYPIDTPYSIFRVSSLGFILFLLVAEFISIKNVQFQLYKASY